MRRQMLLEMKVSPQVGGSSRERDSPLVFRPVEEELELSCFLRNVCEYLCECLIVTFTHTHTDPQTISRHHTPLPRGIKL